MLQLLPSLGQIQFAPGLRADRTLGFGLFLLQLLLESSDARAELRPGQRDFAPFVLHLGKDAFLLSFLGGFFLPASRTHQHVAGSRVNIGQGDPLIAQDEFAHLVGVFSYRAI